MGHYPIDDLRSHAKATINDYVKELMNDAADRLELLSDIENWPVCEHCGPMPPDTRIRMERGKLPEDVGFYCDDCWGTNNDDD